ncbi:hypothetical protein, partial [Streptomyces boluensis]
MTVMTARRAASPARRRALLITPFLGLLLAAPAEAAAATATPAPTTTPATVSVSASAHVSSSLSPNGRPRVDSCAYAGVDLPLEEWAEVARKEGVAEAVRRACRHTTPPPAPK